MNPFRVLLGALTFAGDRDTVPHYKHTLRHTRGVYWPWRPNGGGGTPPGYRMRGYKLARRYMGHRAAKAMRIGAETRMHLSRGGAL